MNFIFGYNENVDDCFDAIEANLDVDANRLSEMYFSFPGSLNGRSQFELSRNKAPDQMFSQLKLISTLQKLKALGVKANLLLNATCYGASEASKEQAMQIDSILRFLDDGGCMPKVMTTSSPAIAMYVKKHYNIEARLSVLSNVCTLMQVKYACEIFDSFYVGFDKTRDIKFLEDVKSWCTQNGKKFGVLVNGGCISNCPYIMYHSNLTAHLSDPSYNECSHDAELCATKDFPCKRMHSAEDPDAAKLMFLQATWIRPEDVHFYENICDFMKLSTRSLESKYMQTIYCYMHQKCNGNLLEVVETSNDNLFIDNQKFPLDYFSHISSCNHNCTKCNYCKSLLKIV